MGLLEKANNYLAQTPKTTTKAKSKAVVIDPLLANVMDDNELTAEKLLAAVETHEVKFPDIKAQNRIYKPVASPVLTASAKTAKQPHKTHKLSKLMKVFAATALLSMPQQLTPHREPTMPDRNVTMHVTSPSPLDKLEIECLNANFALQLKSRVTLEERALLAQLLYGEAGLGTDPIEVIHTVLNRVSSPYFPNTVKAVVTQKNQFEGFSNQHPIVPDFLAMIDLVVSEWEDHGCQPIKDCKRLYFVTGRKGINNKFEISRDHIGYWVNHGKKQYAKLGHYCPTAERQARKFYANRSPKLDYKDDIRPKATRNIANELSR